MVEKEYGDIGLVGLAVMGQNLVLNMNDKGFKVVVFNRTVAKVEEFLEKGAKGTEVRGAATLEECIQGLKRPRKLMLMVKAGAPVDEFIDMALPFLEKGDVIIDGGNSLYTDTERRMKKLQDVGILFVGAGISGGEEGARHGPSIMPGGNEAAWPLIQPIFQGIAAKAFNGKPCCAWVGSGGAGHFVKMVHNGIEYGDMQLIAESYQIMKEGLSLQEEAMADIFKEWSTSELESYLIEITEQILRKKEEDGSYLLDKILDAAGQKGTGKWTVEAALNLGVPLTLITESVFARALSSMKGEREKGAALLSSLRKEFKGDQKEFAESVKYALYASKLVSYGQGFMLLQAAAKEYTWALNFGEIATLWSGGCIIRSRFLQDIEKAYAKDPALSNLLYDEFFAKALLMAEEKWRYVVAHSTLMGIPIPCFSTALSFFDGLRSANLPANLIQAQRDFFGAHNYERKDKERGEFFHTDWTGRGGDVSSTVYDR